MSESLVIVNNVSKKFARNLNKSLWYGVIDLFSELLGLKTNHDELRPDEFWAVKDVSFELKRGDCLGLIGHNGAGKSTLLKMLNGLIKPDTGMIEMRGRVGALIELGAGFNPILTGRENVYVNGQILGFSKKEMDQKLDAIIDFSEIGEFIDTPVRNYSSGMKVRLGFAVAAQMEPDILIIDEVLAVGDVGFRAKSINRIFEILEKSAVIFVSHSLQQVSRICNKVVVLDHGKDCKVPITNHKMAFEKYFSLTVTKSKKYSELIGNGASLELISYFINNHRSNDFVINFASPLKVTLTLKTQHNYEFDVFVYVNFWSLENILVCCLTTEQQHTKHTVSRSESVISLSVDQLFLNAGIYIIEVTIIDARSRKRLLKIPEIAKLTIVSNQIFNGFYIPKIEKTSLYD